MRLTDSQTMDGEVKNGSDEQTDISCLIKVKNNLILLLQLQKKLQKTIEQTLNIHYPAAVLKNTI